MGSQWILYGYGLVCLSMLAFNLLYSLTLRAGDRRLGRRVAWIARQVSPQLERVERGEPVEERHRRRLGRRLSRVKGLLAFDRYLDQMDGENPAVQGYLGQLLPVFLRLSVVYRRREDTQAAYFCHLLTRHQLYRRLRGDHQPARLQGKMLLRMVSAYLERDSLYCRVNALKALCAFGDEEIVVEAVQDLGRRDGPVLHEKVVVETLMTFAGDQETLIGQIWSRFEEFPLSLQRALLDFIRFKSGSHCPRMLSLLMDSSRDKELRFAAIRYVGRYPYEPARQALLDFVADGDPLRWEYAAISASSLAWYPGQEVVDALSRAMHSGNWYVRYNAAASLEAHGLSDEEMARAAGKDRYAREMLAYRLEVRQRMEEAAKAQLEEEEARLAAEAAAQAAPGRKEAVAL